MGKVYTMYVLGIQTRDLYVVYVSTTGSVDLRCVTRWQPLQINDIIANTGLGMNNEGEPTPRNSNFSSNLDIFLNQKHLKMREPSFSCMPDCSTTYTKRYGMNLD